MDNNFYQKLTPGDLVHPRDWDAESSSWVVHRGWVFMVVDVKRDPSSTERNRDVVSILGPENRMMEVYAGYFIKVV